MTIALSMQYNDDFRAIADITVPRIEDYARRHGYSLFVHHTDLKSPEIVWQRVKDVRAILDLFDMVVHLDTDLLITNPDVRIEDITGHWKADIWCGTDANGLNDGFCIFTDSWESEQALRSLLGRDRGHYTSPQHALEHMGQKVGIERITQRKCNSYHPGAYGPPDLKADWQPGDFILHLPGIGNDRRIEILNQYTSCIFPSTEN